MKLKKMSSGGRKILSLLVVMVMLFSCTMQGFAEEDTDEPVNNDGLCEVTFSILQSARPYEGVCEILVQDSKGIEQVPTEVGGKIYSLAPGDYTYTALPSDEKLAKIIDRSFEVKADGAAQTVELTLKGKASIANVIVGGINTTRNGDDFQADSSLTADTTRPGIEVELTWNLGISTANYRDYITLKEVNSEQTINYEASKGKKTMFTPKEDLKPGKYVLAFIPGLEGANYMTDWASNIYFTIGGDQGSGEDPGKPEEPSKTTDVTFEVTPSDVTPSISVFQKWTNKVYTAEADGKTFKLPAGEYTYSISALGYASVVGKVTVVEGNTETIPVALNKGTITIFGATVANESDGQNKHYCYLKGTESTDIDFGDSAVYEQKKPAFFFMLAGGSGMGGTNGFDTNNKGKVKFAKVDGNDRTVVEYNYTPNAQNGFTVVPVNKLPVGDYEITIDPGFQSADGTTAATYIVTFTVAPGEPPVPEPVVPDCSVLFSTNPEDATITVYQKGATSSFFEAEKDNSKKFKLVAGYYSYMVSKGGYDVASGSFTIEKGVEDMPIPVSLDKRKIDFVSVTVDGKTTPVNNGKVSIDAFAAGSKPSIAIEFDKDSNTNFYFEDNQKYITMESADGKKNIPLDYKKSTSGKNLETTIITPKEALDGGDYIIAIAAGFAGDEYVQKVAIENDCIITVGNADPSVPQWDSAAKITVENISQHEADISWTKSTSNDIKEYKVVVDGTVFATTTETNCKITELATGTSHNIVVRAVNTSGKESRIPSSVLLATTGIALTELNYNFTGTQGAWTMITENPLKEKADGGKQMDFQLVFANVPAAEETSFFTDKIKVFRGDTSGTLVAGCTPKTTNTLGKLKVSIPAGTLEANASYTLVIDKSIAGDSYDREIVFFTGVGTTPPQTASFSAIFAYPVNGAANVAVDQPITVAFNKAAKNKTISNSSVLLKNGSETVNAVLNLDDSKQLLTITPFEPLKYGTAYRLELTGDIASGDEKEKLKASKIDFKTKSFDVKDVTVDAAADNASISAIKVNIENLSGTEQSANLKIEIRRDLGARLSKGGTVVYLNQMAGQNALANTKAELVFSGLNIDLTKNINGDADEIVQGNTYIDIYVLDENGRQIAEVYHKQLKF